MIWLRLEALIIRYQDMFDLRTFTAIQHEVNTGNTPPIKQRMRRTQIRFINEEEQHLQKMLDAGIIEPPISEWVSPPVLVRKRDDNVRCCIGYRRLSSVTKRDQVYPLPLIEECLDTLSDNTWFTKLDTYSAYYHIRMLESDKNKTAFLTKYGLFHFTRMGFGLCNVPSTFARAMNLVLRGLTCNVVLAFSDGILVLGQSFNGHLRNPEEVFTCFRTFWLELKPKKCLLFHRKVEFLGRSVDKEGMKLREEYVKAVQEWPVPKTTKEVANF